MNHKKAISIAIAVGVLGIAGTYYQRELSPVAMATAESTVPVANPRMALPDFTDLVIQTSPAVVSVRVTHMVPTKFQGGGPRGFDGDDPMSELFKRFGAPRGGPRQGPGQGEGDGPIARGEGSGFIITPDGYIMTNAHVVAEADEVQVQLADKRELKAKVIGVDPTSDVAVIKIAATGLPTLKIGSPDNLKVGEWVIAIGSPFGFDHTVSAGVVSAKMRALPDGGNVPFIQTDVAINPGNSGGPLINLRGEVVGMNAQIYSNSGGYMGLSFAIPIDLAMNIQTQLVQHGKVTRGRLGVMVQTIDQQLADSFGLKKPEGALVSAVQPDAPAAKAGIRAGDVILTVDGTPIDDSAALSRLITGKTPGATVNIRLIRNGKTEEIKVALGEMDGGPTVASNERGPSSGAGRLGAVVRPLDEDAKRELGTDHGVVVEQSGGAAAKAGIRAGDVILSVNTNPVKSPEQLRSLLDQAPDHVALLVRRDNNEIFVPVKLG